MENIDDILIKVLMSCCRVSLKPGESWTPRPTVNGIADTTSLSDKSQIHRFPEQQDRHLIELCNIEKKKKQKAKKRVPDKHRKERANGGIISMRNACLPLLHIEALCTAAAALLSHVDREPIVWLKSKSRLGSTNDR